MVLRMERPPQNETDLYSLTLPTTQRIQSRLIAQLDNMKLFNMTSQKKTDDTERTVKVEEI